MFLSITEKQERRAVAYYRHSAEDKQENSVAIQQEQAQKFCAEAGFTIIQELADEGKTGLNANRPAFKSLFKDWVENPNAPFFNCVIVYDPSRWGRFRDRDEAAHYEHICRKHGKEVFYVTHGIPDKKQKRFLHMRKFMEREMASEYSEILSDKVLKGCIKVSQQGYSAGGCACYGMVRLMLDADKKPDRILKYKQHKSISNARVTFQPANDETTQVVKDIFLHFSDGKTIEEIALLLNERKIPSAKGGKWNREKILRILKNETYIGTRIYNKTTNKLKEGHHKNPKHEWVIVPNAFTGILDKETFYRAQKLLPQSRSTTNKSNNMKSVRRFVHGELRSLLIDKKINEDDVFITLREFPVIYSVSCSQSKTPFWCFIARHELRRYKNVLGISISKDTRNPIDKIFVIPTEEFGQVDFNIFSEKDDVYERYSLKETDVEKTVLSIAQEMGVILNLDYPPDKNSLMYS